MSARNMFYRKNKKFSKAEERLFAREELIFNVTEDLLVIMEDDGVSKAELARRLGKSKSFITQILSGARNMTLGSFSDICFSLGFKPKIELPVAEVETVEASVSAAQENNVVTLKEWNGGDEILIRIRDTSESSTGNQSVKASWGV